MQQSKSSVLIVLMVLTVTLSGCGSTPTQPEAAADLVSGQAATSTIAQTETPAPTATSKPTATPEPTATPKPTATPRPTATPAPEKLTLLKGGFGQDGREVAAAFIVQNPNEHQGIEQAAYQVAIYDADGTVIASSNGSIYLLYPGQQLGVVETVYVPEGATAARIDVNLRAGKFHEMSRPAADPFSTENINYIPDDYFPKATGIVKSLLKSEVTKLRVAAIAYNDADEIIGGGFTYLDFVPANGQAAVEISVTTAAVPARLELYPVVTILSEFSE